LTTPEAVAQWLRSLAPEDVCGWPHIPNACPLAHFLNAQNREPAHGASVGSDSYILAGARYPLAAWAQHFVARVDHAPARWDLVMCSAGGRQQCHRWWCGFPMRT
jgi:hypothetical protein